ncbi:hypothetical protein E4T50_01889 [Aureobasidium sp. EXF-12298]|nr:hypothetical protein E4T50_01889 [Aureobasidium sp. EXF-12298]
MEHALFLDKPIRGNPRRQAAQQLSVSMLPSPPFESGSPASSAAPLRYSPAHEANDSDASPISTAGMSTAEHMAIIASMTRPQWRTDNDVLVTIASPDHPPEVPMVAPSPKQQRKAGHRTLTKAACSACRQRKIKCDGKRPTCTTCRTKKKSCEYLTEEGVSSQTAYKTRLEDYGTVLRLLQRSNDGECKRILEDLRRPKGLIDGVKSVLEKWVEKD